MSNEELKKAYYLRQGVNKTFVALIPSGVAGMTFFISILLTFVSLSGVLSKDGKSAGDMIEIFTGMGVDLLIIYFSLGSMIFWTYYSADIIKGVLQERKYKRRVA